MKTCTMIGPIPENFPWDYLNRECDEQQEYLESMACNLYYLIHNQNISHFIAGSNLGFDLDFAEMLIQIRDNYDENIFVELVLPCKIHYSQWNSEDQKRILKIIQYADKLTYLSDTYQYNYTLSTYKFLIDNSDKIFIYFNKYKKGGIYHTIKYTKSTNKELTIINL